jgi:hypothetical protein
MSGYERGVSDARKPKRSFQAVQTTHNVDEMQTLKANYALFNQLNVLVC